VRASLFLRAAGKTAFLPILLVFLYSCTRTSLTPTKGALQTRDDVKLTEGSNGKEVQLTVGQTFTIALAETPTTGYRWKVANDGAPICSLIRDSFEPSSRQLGSRGVHEWHFQANTPGTATIEMRLAREWDPNSATRSLVLHLRVT
jgi:inhibitor of cysteine peptidase